MKEIQGKSSLVQVNEGSSYRESTVQVNSLFHSKMVNACVGIQTTCVAIQTNDKLCWNGYRFFRQEVNRELRLAEKVHVRNEIANSRGNTNATWKILNRCMSRGTAKRPSSWRTMRLIK